MRSTLRRRGTMTAAVAALSVSGLVVAAGGASATALIHVTNGGVGVYNQARTSAGKVGVPDLGPGDYIISDCWDRGANIGGGNVWYQTISEHYASTGQDLFISGWTHGAHVDGNAAFHNGDVPEC
jgi:hypothetical protein